MRDWSTMKAIVFAVAFILCFFGQGVHGDGCLIPKRFVGGEARLSTDICNIIDALERSPPDYVTAETIYREGSFDRDITLMKIATGEALQGSFTNNSIEHFDKEEWMDDLIQEAFEGEGVFTDDVKRVEFITKVLQSSLLAHRFTTNIRIMFNAITRGEKRQALRHLERALADWYGKNPECAIFGHGQARGIEFGIMNDGVAVTIEAAAEGFRNSELALLAEPVDFQELELSLNPIRRNMFAIYLQAVVKYTTRIINGIDPEKAQAEGFAYYFTLASHINGSHPEAHDAFSDAFDIAVKPNKRKARKALALVPEVLPFFGITEEVFGDYDEDRAASYKAPEIDEANCEGLNPFSRKPVGTDADR